MFKHCSNRVEMTLEFKACWKGRDLEACLPEAVVLGKVVEKVALDDLLGHVATKLLTSSSMWVSKLIGLEGSWKGRVWEEQNGLTL